MKKMLFLAAIALLTNTAFAQQPVAKKSSKKEVKKEAKTAKKEEKVEATSAVEALNPTPVSTPISHDGHQHEAAKKVEAAAPQVDINKVFEFTNDNYDFGKIVGGKPVEYIVTIKNISKEEATLTNVQVTCGCTTPKYEANKKFAPGESVQVTLGFNGGSPGQATPFTKSVNITLNSTLTKSVTFKGETYVAPAEPAPANPSINKF